LTPGSRRRIARLMRHSALKAKTRRGFKPCRNSGSKTAGVAENLLQQDFAPPAPNRAWAGDITYIRTTAGWRYLAVWIDLYSRRVVGWAMGATMEATLVLEALNRALGHRQVEPDQLLIHTDRGSPIPSNGLPAAVGKPQDHLQHVGQGLLLGQRSGRELFLHPQT
jgi:putative transposase